MLCLHWHHHGSDIVYPIMKVLEAVHHAKRNMEHDIAPYLIFLQDVYVVCYMYGILRPY